MKKQSIKIAAFIFAIVAAVSAFFTARAVYPVKFSEEISEYAEKNGLRVSLVYAVINTESGFCENKVSEKGATGLMQLMPSTAKFVAETFCGEERGDLFSPETNIRYGTRYLRYLKDKFKSEDTALAAYNAGEGNAAKWLADKNYSVDGVTLIKIPFKETERYVKRVRRAEKFYNILYSPLN